MQERLPSKHGGEELGDRLDHLLNRCGVAEEGNCHLQTLGRNVADASLDVVRDPLDKI